MENNWFKSWFDSPYYHILYKHRNHSDAELFINNITKFLKLPKTSHIADLPCGKGRHAIYLNKLGYKVTAGDLSNRSITHAKQFENDNLNFEVWDMRNPLKNSYDAVFNLFTSFGYFDDDNEDIKVLQNIKKGLKPNGILVLDFLNVEKLYSSLVPKETKVIANITFNIERKIENGFIYKNISFNIDGEQKNYTEQVKLLNLKKFQDYFDRAGLKLFHTFGDYYLNEFDKQKSDRLILIAK